MTYIQDPLRKVGARSFSSPDVPSPTPSDASSSVVSDAFAAHAVAAHAAMPEVPICPVLGALLKQGAIRLDSSGRARLSDVSRALMDHLRMTRPLAWAVTSAGPVGNRPAAIVDNLRHMRFNPLRLREGVVKHPGDSAILTPGTFDEARFEALVSHAVDGEMTLEAFAKAIEVNVQRDLGVDTIVRGLPLSIIEFGALLDIFGQPDIQTGTLSLSVDSLRRLYQKGELPPLRNPGGAPKTLGGFVATLAKLAGKVSLSSAVGRARAGADRVVAQGPSGALSAAGSLGAAKAVCPYMQGASTRPPPTHPDTIANLHVVP